MRNVNYLSGGAAMVLLLLTIGTASAKCPLPTREIDRPLQDTVGVRGIDLGVALERRYTSLTRAYKFSFTGVSYSLTDRIALTSLPWPVIQILVLKPRQDARIGTMQPLQIAVRAGVTSSLMRTQISRGAPPDDYIRVFPRVNVLAKLPMTRRLWVDGEVAAGTIADEAMQAFWTPRLGIQLSNRFFGAVGYHGELIRFWDYRPWDRATYFYRYATTIDFSRSSQKYGYKTYLANTMPIMLGCNLGPMSMELSTSISRSIRNAVPVSFTTRFSW